MFFVLNERLLFLKSECKNRYYLQNSNTFGEKFREIHKKLLIK